MKPPAIDCSTLSGAGIDLPARARPRYGLRWPVVLGVATLLGVLSTALALQLHPRAWKAEHEPGRRSSIVERHLLVRLGAVYPVDRLALAALPVRAAGARSRACSIHLPSVVAVLVRAHRRDGRRAVVALGDAPAISLVGRK